MKFKKKKKIETEKDIKATQKEQPPKPVVCQEVFLVPGQL